ncbi:VOC family protein [Occultella kanbiaonis]|uniref:VOC family protein n=1 Tax=Occultella kanbiaonis TaxID=2675754 RepID=UPI0012B8845F|nr:VOC family protein [Occultella kanbiaonis]
MPNITPNLWFESRAEEAAELYTSIFPNSSIGHVERYGPGAPMPEGTVMTVAFSLDGKQFVGLNGGPAFAFTEAISFIIECADQAEVDHYWGALTADGGQESQCAWLKDRFGVSWQVVPRRLMELLGDPDPERAGRAMEAMLLMRKIDIAAVERAADG